MEGDRGTRGESRRSGVISFDVGPVKSSSVKEGLSFEIIEASVKVGV